MIQVLDYSLPIITVFLHKGSCSEIMKTYKTHPSPSLSVLYHCKWVITRFPYVVPKFTSFFFIRPITSPAALMPLMPVIPLMLDLHFMHLLLFYMIRPVYLYLQHMKVSLSSIMYGFFPLHCHIVTLLQIDCHAFIFI